MFNFKKLIQRFIIKTIVDDIRQNGKIASALKTYMSDQSRSSSFEYTIKADTTAIDTAIDELRSYMASDKRLSELFFDCFNSIDELVEIETCSAVHAESMSVILKPSKFFLDLLTAGRAGNFEKFVSG